MKKNALAISLLTTTLLFSPFCSMANTLKSIKLAVFDNPEIDTTNTQLSKSLQTSYMQGVTTAINVAKKYGISINVKTFFYGSSLLNIMQEAPNVKAWNPDVVIGLNSSNASLMSRPYFDDSLVLSISATDIELSQLPSNFYSLGVPDAYAAPALIKFIDRYYPRKDLFLIIGADSKESMDFGNQIASLYKNKHPSNNVTISKFLSDEVDSINLPSLVQGYKPGDVILLFSLAGSYDAQIKLMNELANYLSPNKLVFVNDVDNWNNRAISENPSIIKNPYTAYRLDTLYVDTNTSNYKTFEKTFTDIYQTKPTDSISFITYQAVMSFVTALEKYPPPKGLTQKKAILWSYQQALKHDPNWFRPTPLIMYKIESNKELYFTSYK